MSANFEFVNHPSEFESQLLRENIAPLPVPDPPLQVETYYLAVFDKDINYPRPEQYRALLVEELRNEDMIEAVLTQPPRQQFGFGASDHHVTVSLYVFVPDVPEGVTVTEMEMVVLIEVENITSMEIH